MSYGWFTLSCSRVWGLDGGVYGTRLLTHGGVQKVGP